MALAHTIPDFVSTIKTPSLARTTLLECLKTASISLKSLPVTWANSWAKGEGFSSSVFIHNPKDFETALSLTMSMTPGLGTNPACFEALRSSFIRGRPATISSG